MTHVFNDSMPLALLHYMGLAKRKGVFEHAQNTQIQIHPTHGIQKVSTRHLLSNDTLYSVQ